MNTPIVDFVKKYNNDGYSRFHMPGHKGWGALGIEKYDITEIFGADCLSTANGIIKESEDNASSLFSTGHSFYSAFGSTSVICAMLALACKGKGEKPVVLALRNVHRAFVHGAALLDIDVRWIMPKKITHIAGCDIGGEDVEKAILSCEKKPAAVYVTSPDYLGNILDISSISSVCKKHSILLLTDNAHGAYLAFTKEKLHPIHLGADMCADSAHKTLPVLTGGAYLHVSKDAPSMLIENARDALMLFSSTSPSYLILQSLDLCNKYIDDGYRQRLDECIKKIDYLKKYIADKGFVLLESEPLKIVIDAKKSGYTGDELAKILRNQKAEIEFSDSDYAVFMITPENSDEDFDCIKNVFDTIVTKSPITPTILNVPTPRRAMTVRQATLSNSEMVETKNAKGEICAELTVSCPPAIPIAVSGEIIDEDHIKLFEYYDIKNVKVVSK